MTTNQNFVLALLLMVGGTVVGYCVGREVAAKEGPSALPVPSAATSAKESAPPVRDLAWLRAKTARCRTEGGRASVFINDYDDDGPPFEFVCWPREQRPIWEEGFQP